MKTTGNTEIDDSKATWIISSDEVGYGAWAGPMTVAGAAVPRDWSDPRVKDSKQFTGDTARKERQAIFQSYIENPGDVIWVVRIATPEEIDKTGAGVILGLLHTQVLSYLRGELAKKGVTDPLVIADGNLSIEGAISLPKADALVPACSLASIIAKAHRDSYMENLPDSEGYGWSSHCGYGTLKHRESLIKLGVSPLHRRSYAPVREFISVQEELREAWAIDDDSS